MRLNTSKDAHDDNNPSDAISKCFQMSSCTVYIPCNIVGMESDLSIKPFNNIIEFLGDDRQLSKCHESIKETLTSENMIRLQPNLYTTAIIENVYLSIYSAISSANISSGSNSDSDDDITDFKQTFSVAPGQKHEKQVRFYRTSHKCGRKINGKEMFSSKLMYLYIVHVYYNSNLMRNNHMYLHRVADAAKKHKLVEDLNKLL